MTVARISAEGDWRRDYEAGFNVNKALEDLMHINSEKYLKLGEKLGGIGKCEFSKTLCNHDTGPFFLAFTVFKQ